MPDLAKITAVESKLIAEAEPSPDAVSASSPDGTTSGAGSAPADGAGGGPVAGEAPGTSPGASIDHEALRAKLEADRARRAVRAHRRQLAAEAEAAKKAREDAEAEKSKWSQMGKGKSFLDTIKELGRDPRETFAQMQEEALKAGTPEAKLDAMERAFAARIDQLEKALEAEKTGRTTERQNAQKQAEEHAFTQDFQRGIREERFASLTEEYEPRQLFGAVDALRQNPRYLHQQARALGVGLTLGDGRFTMIDILNVLKATQDRHNARLEEQRRKKSAAPPAAPGAEATTPVAKPTVNGTAERNAGTSLGNQLAATRAADPSPRKETREQRVARLGNKYG